jgi:hypothetical protein
MKKNTGTDLTIIAVICTSMLSGVVYINYATRDSEAKSRMADQKLNAAYGRLTLAETAYKQAAWHDILSILAGDESDFSELPFEGKVRVDFLKQSAEVELKAFSLASSTDWAIKRKDWKTAIQNVSLIDGHVRGTFCEGTLIRFAELKRRIKDEIGDYEQLYVDFNEDVDSSNIAGSYSAGPSYSGLHRSYSDQGGHYVGGQGSSHKGGHYVNSRTGNHYSRRK